MKPVVEFADAERAIVDYLSTKLPDVNVGTFFPKSSTDAPSVPFLQVGWDGTPAVVYPVTQRATVRLTAWGSSPTPAKALFARAQGYLSAHPGDASVWSTVPLTGGLPTRDPDTLLFLCSGTFRVNVRPSALV